MILYADGLELMNDDNQRELFRWLCGKFSNVVFTIKPFIPIEDEAYMPNTIMLTDSSFKYILSRHIVKNKYKDKVFCININNGLYTKERGIIKVRFAEISRERYSKIG